MKRLAKQKRAKRIEWMIQRELAQQAAASMQLQSLTPEGMEAAIKRTIENVKGGGK